MRSKLNRGRIDNFLRENGLFCFILTAVSVFLFRRCGYGFADVDESFYLTVPYRLCQGDGLFGDEWHLSQMSGFLLYPFMKLYLALNGNTEGIFLTFRYLYVTVQIITGIMIYRILTPYSKAGAIFSAAVFMIYAPFGIPALSYNSMGIICLTLSGLFLTGRRHSEYASGNAPVYASAASGVFFAFSVLCCPYLMIAYGVYAVTVLLCRLRKKNTELVLLSAKSFVTFSAGAAAVAAVFFSFLLSRTSVDKLLTVLPCILDDPEHEPVSFTSKILSGAHAIVHGNAVMPYLTCVWILLFCIAGRMKKQSGHRRSVKSVKDLFLPALILTAVQTAAYIYYNNFINFLMFPIVFLSSFTAFLFRNKKNRELFCTLCVPGFLYMFSINLSSNVEAYAMASAATVADVGGAVIIISSLKDEILTAPHGRFRGVAGAAVALFCMLQITSQLYYRWNFVFWDDHNSISSQLVMITEGPEKGLTVSEEKSDYYAGLNSDLKKLPDADSVLFFSDKMWLYLCGSWKNSSYSAWLAGVDQNAVRRLETYYHINPEKLPDVIYVEHGYEAQIEDLSELGFETADTDSIGSVMVRS